MMCTENEAISWLKKALGLAEADSPFPWQRRLLEKFLNGQIPCAVDIPTGLGKTSVMAIWLVARACGANLPRRLVYVVDRRAVVDQATTEAEKLRRWVDARQDVKNALGLERSLPISTLRGQYVDNRREWLEDPAAPAIIVGTVDMIGSRLLFQGYGVSRKMRSYHAGLLGADALVVLDEAHLVPPFEHLLRAIETDQKLWPRDVVFRQLVPFKVVALSATGRTRSDDVFGLTNDDFEHDVVKQRLHAKKSLQLVLLDEGAELEEGLAEQAWTLAGEGKNAVRVLVYADSREDARKAKEAIEKRAGGGKKAGKPRIDIETELFVGSRRVFEREHAKRRLEELGFLAESQVPRYKPTFLFATSAGEVGVDLDADHMVCDLVAWERMVQRLGRVNRRGGGEAKVIVIVKPKPKPNKNEQEALNKQKRNEKLEDEEKKRVEEYEKKVRDWENRLKPIIQLRKDDNGSYDASPAALHELKQRAATDPSLERLLQDATTPDPLRPSLTRPLVEAWSMTSLEKHTGRPDDIQPWLRGWIEDKPQTRLVWRKYLPIRPGGGALTKKEVEGFFEAASPHVSEFLETETFHVTSWLEKRTKKVIDQVKKGNESLPGENAVVAFALAPDGTLRHTLTLEELDQKKIDNSELAGVTLVVDARIGGLKDGLLDDDANDIPRTADDGQDWLGEGVVGFRVRSVEASEVASRERNWRERFRFATEETEDGEVSRWLIVEKWRYDAATEEDRSASNPQLLDEHQDWAETRARCLAQSLKLDDALVEVLALAARLHDEGKRAQRWQRAFRAPKDGVYAKTEGPIDYQLLGGYRHELGSVLRVRSGEHLPQEIRERFTKLSEEHRDLVLHLIAAHHGFARPVIATSGCEDAPPSALDEMVAEIALRFARLQDRWGPWGLAWWEALLRAADQQASRDNDERVPARGAM